MNMPVIPKFIFIIMCVAFTTSNAFSQINPEPDLDIDINLNKNRLKTVLFAESAVYVSGLYFLNTVWYKNHRSVPFHFYNDLQGWLQVDKAGHIFSSYYESYYGMKALRWTGVSRRNAIWLGGSLGLLMQTPIEIFDGLYEGYGFSFSDMAANSVGSALVISQELLWEEQRITMRFSYHPTRYPKYRPSTFGNSKTEHFFTDYNGHTYWLSANLRSFFQKTRLPRWLNLAVGYGADGMLGEFDNPRYNQGKQVPVFKRSRQFYLSIDLNLKAIQTRSPFLNSVLEALNMIKFPAPAIKYSKAGGIVFHPIYF